MNSACSVGGEFKFTVLNGDGTVAREYPWQKNLITNIGMDRLAGGQFCNFCRIGTGNTVPSFADTALQAQVAATSNIINTSYANAGAPNYESTAVLVFEYPLGAVVGNMAEIGVGWTGSSANTLFSRALINNAGGSPTTITVLASEILQVSYRFTIYPQLADATGTCVIGGVTYNYLARSGGIASVATSGILSGFTTGSVGFIFYDGAIGTILTQPTSNIFNGVANGQAYTTGNFYVDYVATASISQANSASGILSVYHQELTRTQVQFTPAIPKNSTNQLSLTTRFSWARH